MKSCPPASVRWIGREAVRCELGSLAIDAMCYFDAERNAYVVVLGDRGTRSGEVVHLSATELTQVEGALRHKLTVKRFLGIPVGRRQVYVQSEQHVL